MRVELFLKILIRKCYTAINVLKTQALEQYVLPLSSSPGRSRNNKTNMWTQITVEFSKHTEVQHWWRIVAGPVVGDQIDLSLSLLLLYPQLGPAVAVSTETAEEDQHSPQEPKPCGKKKKNRKWIRLEPSAYHFRFISKLSLQQFYCDINFK